MPDLGGIWAAFASSAPVQFSVRFFGLYLVALYLAMVFWTVRDAQHRTENPFLPYVAGIVVVALNVLGLFVYLIVRPRETLHEAYERQLAEESLLAEAEQRAVCPSCKERVDPEFVICPSCRTRLRRACPSCARLIKPEWTICPYCAKTSDERDWAVQKGTGRPSVAEQARSVTGRETPSAQTPSTQTPSARERGAERVPKASTTTEER